MFKGEKDATGIQNRFLSSIYNGAESRLRKYWSGVERRLDGTPIVQFDAQKHVIRSVFPASKTVYFSLLKN